MILRVIANQRISTLRVAFADDSPLEPIPTSSRSAQLMVRHRSEIRSVGDDSPDDSGGLLCAATYFYHRQYAGGHVLSLQMKALQATIGYVLYGLLALIFS